MDVCDIGRTLRVERERKRLSLDTISRATMVHRKYLECIDAGDMDKLPSGAYAKGFIRAYSNYIGVDPIPLIRTFEKSDESGPELTSFTPQPVRVPNASHSRTWRLASAVAVLILAILGLIGAFGPEEGDKTLPSPPVAAALASVDAPTTNPTGAVVRIEAVDGDTWFVGFENGVSVYEGLLRMGEHKILKGDTVYLELGNPGAVRISANGRDLGAPTGAAGYKATFTPETEALPV